MKHKLRCIFITMILLLFGFSKTATASAEECVTDLLNLGIDYHICTDFTDYGVCKTCGTKFVLENRTTLNCKAKALKQNGAIHVEPYGLGTINGRLVENAWYTVAESATNAFGKIWYRLEGMDTKTRELWVVASYLELHTVCTEFDDFGYCKICNKEFSLQNVQSVNRWLEATKEDGALHDRPYGEAIINGRLKQGQRYLVIQSGTNSFGGLWYLVTDTDGINKWVTSDYLKEIFTAYEQQGTSQYAAPKSLPLLTGMQAEDVAQIACSQLGYRQEHGKGTVYGAWWNNVTNWGANYTNSDWCAMFACWCADQAGAGLYEAFNKSSAQVISLFNYISETGFCDTTFQTEPRPGDFIFFKNNNTTLTLPHVAIVVFYDPQTKEITYVGGNQWLNNSCRSAVTLGSCKWQAGAKPKGEKLYVYGYGRPAYENSAVMSIPESLVPLITSDKISYNVGEKITLQRNDVHYANYHQIMLYCNGEYIWETPMNEVVYVLSDLQPGKYDVYLHVGNDVSSNSRKCSFTVVDNDTTNTIGNNVAIEVPVPNNPVQTTPNIIVQATGAGNITAYNATVYGNASYDGTHNRPSEIGLLFGESKDNLQWAAGEPINFSKNPFDIWYDLEKEAHLKLVPGKTYYYQLYAVVNGQYSYSNIESFTTQATVRVWTSGARNVTATNATVYGSVQYSGNRTSEVGLFFGESADSLRWVAGEPTNFSKNPYDVWYDLNKEAGIWLSPGKTYFYQFYAIQDGITVFSDIGSFSN